MVVCSKNGIVVEASINWIQNIKSAVWVHLCLAWQMGKSKDITSHVIDILSHSLGPLSSVLSAADWVLRNTREGTPVSAITTLGEAFWDIGLYHQYYMIMHFEAVDRVQQGQCHGVPSRWMSDTRCWKQASGENPTCHCKLQTLLSCFQE